MGYFMDRNHSPTEEEIQAALGSRYVLWQRLKQFVERQTAVQSKWSFWGPEKSGWNLRYRRKGKALVALYPQQGQLVVNVVLGTEHAKQVLKLELRKKVHKLIASTPQLHDGRWLFLPVENDKDVEEVEQLLAVKMNLKGSG
jgi:hypothetical protein